jgi:hypothetical protein
MVRFVGAGEMADHQRELKRAPQVLRALDGLDLRGGKSKPVHAAVDMDGGGKLGARGLTECRPFFNLDGAVEHRA